MDTEDVLYQNIITRAKFEDAFDEITFKAPVCLTSLKLGAVPTFGSHHATINIFARDIKSNGSSRLVCIYEGLKQPESGSESAPLQGFVTNHVVIRGNYQTIPVSIHGYTINELADQFNHTQALQDIHSYKSNTITAKEAFQSFDSIVSSLREPTCVSNIQSPSSSSDKKHRHHHHRSSKKESHSSTGDDKKNSLDYKKDIKPALDAALSYYKRVGALPRKIASHPIPKDTFDGIIRTADSICSTLSRLESDDDVFHAILSASKSSQSSSKSSRSSTTTTNTNNTTTNTNTTNDDDDAWVAECINMAMGWTSLLADIHINTNTPSLPTTTSRQHVLDCACSGIASTILILLHNKAASSFIARYGVLILADVLRTKHVPTSCLRHAMCAAMVLIHNSGAWGCESLLSWWKPLHVKWKETIKTTTTTTTTAGHGGGGSRDTNEKHSGGDLRNVIRQRKEEKKRSARSPSPLPPPTDTEALIDKEYMSNSSKYWERRMKEYSGVYDDVSMIMMELQMNKEVAVFGKHVMRALQVYSDAAVFSNEVEELMYRLKDGKVVDVKKAMDSCVRCGGCLSDLAALLASSMHRTNNNTIDTATTTTTTTSSLLELSCEPSKLFIELIESRRVVSLIPALLSIPGAYIALLSSHHRHGTASTSHTQSDMLSSFACGCKELLSVLMSSVRGLKLLSNMHEESKKKEGKFIQRLEESLVLVGIDDVAESIQYLAISLLAVKNLCSSSSGGDRNKKRKKDDGIDKNTTTTTTTTTSDDNNNNEWWTSQSINTSISTLASLIHSNNPSKQIPSLCALRLFSSVDRLYTLFIDAVVCVCDVLQLSTTGEQYSSSNNRWNEKRYKLSLDVVDVLYAWLMEGHPSIVAAWHRYLITSNNNSSTSSSDTTPVVGKKRSSTSGDTNNTNTNNILQSIDGLVDRINTQSLSDKATDVLHKIQYIRGCLHSLSTNDTTTTTTNTSTNTSPSSSSTIIQQITSLLVSHLPSRQHSSNSIDEAAIQHTHWNAVQQFWNNPFIRGQTQTALHILTSLLWHNGHQHAIDMCYADGVDIITRAVQCGTELLIAAHTDTLWIHRVGASIDPGRARQHKRAVLHFLLSAAAAAHSLLQHLRTVIAVHSAPCLTALINAHAALCVDDECLLFMKGQQQQKPLDTTTTTNTTTMDDTSNNSSIVITTRRQITGALRCWIEAPDIIASTLPPSFSPTPPSVSSPSWSRVWTPSFFDTLLTGPYKQEALSPQQLFTATCLLGDLFPNEWPLSGRRSSQPPPSVRRYRFLLAHAIENSQEKFKNLLSCCAMSESVYLRAAMVRCMARASGLGGGMGTFVLEPIVLAMDAAVAVNNSSGNQAHDVRNVLEVLVPCVYHPAMKAAMLDSSIPTNLARALSIMIAGSTQTVPTIPPVIDPLEAQSQCTMIIECLLTLCNTDICLDPNMSQEQSAAEETLSVVQSTSVSAVLLEHLATLGANIPLAKDVIKLLVKTTAGRIGLRHAATALHYASTGQPVPQEPRPDQIIAGAQFIANRYWTMASSMKDNAAMISVYQSFMDVCTAMKDICIDIDRDVPPVPPAPAPMRFAAAAQAAIAARSVTMHGDGRRRDNDVRWEYPWTFSSSLSSTTTATRSTTNCSAVDVVDGGTTDVFDSVSRVFWRNHAARAVAQTPAANAATLRRFYRRECVFDADNAMEMLHAPLTPANRMLMRDNDNDNQQHVDGATAVHSVGGSGGVLMADTVAKVEKEEEVSAVVKEEEENGNNNIKQEQVKKEDVIVESVEKVVPVVVPVQGGVDDFDLYADLMGADAPMSETKQPDTKQEKQQQVVSSGGSDKKVEEEEKHVVSFSDDE